MLVHGQPHWFRAMLTIIELVLPPIYFWLASADERAVRQANVDRSSLSLL